MIRSLHPADLDAVAAINAACVPEVGPADVDRLSFIVDESICALVADLDGAVAGFLLGLGPGSAYDSVNYRWFAQRHSAFGYIDRIALAPAARGRGVGVELYRRFEAVARDHGAAVLTAEVNVAPPNPRSMRFHERFGFVVAAETRPEGTDDHRVAMVEKALS